MTNISVTKTPGVAYTWRSFPYAWSSIVAKSRDWAGANALDYSAEFGETLAVAEASGRGVSKSFTESVSVGDSLSKDLYKSVSETLAVAETYSELTGFVLRIVESFSFTERAGSDITIADFVETFGISDAATRDIGKVIVETLAFDESWSRVCAFHRDIVESLSLSEVAGRHVTIPLTESLSVTEATNRSVDLNVSEALAIADVWGRVVAFNLAIAEGFSITEATNRAVTISPVESFAVLDQYRKNSNAVISDIRIGPSADMTNDDFVQLVNRASAAGYEEFGRLMAGDYEYQKAIVKVVMSSAGIDRAQLDVLKLDVDVPDVNDRGSQTVPAAQTVVTFNRSFSAPPEVGIGLKSGTTATKAEIVAITKNDFTVQLLDGSGTIVGGSISWTAQGY